MDLVCFPSQTRTIDRIPEGRPKESKAHGSTKAFIPQPQKTHGLFTSPAVDQLDNIKNGIATGPYRERTRVKRGEWMLSLEGKDYNVDKGVE